MSTRWICLRTTAVASVAALALALGGCATSSSNASAGGAGDETGAEEAGDGETSEASPPSTERREVVEEIFGTKVRDPYRWLEPSDDEAVQEWESKQDSYTRDYLEELPLRDKLKERFEELYYVDSVSAPQRRGGRMFYARQHAEDEKETYYWRSVGDSADDEQVLLDPNEMSEERDANISIGSVDPAWDGKKVAYTVKENNADRATLYIRDVESGEDREVDVIEGARWANPSWTPESDGFYYTRYPTDESIPPPKRPGEADVRFHELGTDPADDRIVQEPTHDPRTFQGVELSRNGRWLVRFVSHGWSRTDLYLRDLRAEDSGWTPLVEGRDAKYGAYIHEGQIYIRTNEGAPKYRIFRTSVDAPKRSNWTEIVEESEEAVLDEYRLIGDRLVLSYLKDAHSRIETRSLDGSDPQSVELPGLGTAYRVAGQPEHEKAYITYESFKSPKQIYETTVATGETELWSETEVPADLSSIAVDQVWYESADGTEVSMYVLYDESIERDGSTPFLMTGYGGFDVSYTPFFVEHIVPWLEAGGGFALPNLRGGGEYGEKWHEAGMLENKQNTFDDFIAAAEYLIDEGYTSPERLAIRGASNGGLLVGATMTQRPDLFGAVVCGVPLLDMVRYTEFGPAKTWVHEYGDPEKEEHFEFLYEYSPYHNVEKGTEYPAVLMLSASNDDRVHPMHARKMTAALQWATSSSQPILFRLQKEAGHGGANRIESRVAEQTDVYAFLFDELGLEW